MGNTASFSGGVVGPKGGTESSGGRKLLDLMMDALRAAGFDQENAALHVGWMRGFILFHDKRHPHKQTWLQPAAVSCLPGSVGKEYVCGSGYDSAALRQRITIQQRACLVGEFAGQRFVRVIGHG